MKFFSRFFVLPFVCLFLSSSAFAAKELSLSETGAFQPVQSLDQSLAKSQSSQVSAEFFSGDFFDGGLTVPAQPIPQLKINTASYAESRADRASFKALLASKGITYITDADLDSLESNTPPFDLSTNGYLLSIAGKNVAIAFMGSKLTPGGFQAASKTAVFKNKVKQYELDYPFVTGFEGFQMAFTKEDLLVTSYYGQIAVDSVKLDSSKQILERKTDLYDNSGSKPVFQNTRTILYDPSTHQKTHEIIDQYFAPGDSADRQLQIFYYDNSGSISGFFTETYKNKKVLWRSFEEREDIECGQPVLCSNAVSYQREDYTYYTNGRLQGIVYIELDPDTNALLYQANLHFENTPKNLLTSVEESAPGYSANTVFTYSPKGVIQSAFTTESFTEEGASIQQEITALFNKSGVITDETLKRFENGVLRREEITEFLKGFPSVLTVKIYDEFGNLIDTQVTHY